MFNHRTRRNVLFTIQQTLGRALSQTRNISGENHFFSPQFPLAVPFHPHSKHSSVFSLHANHNPHLNRNLRQGSRFETAKRITFFCSLQLPLEPLSNRTFWLFLWASMQTQAGGYTEHPSSPCTGFVQAHRKKAQGRSQFFMNENSRTGPGSFQRGKVKGKVMGTTCKYQNPCKAPVSISIRGVDMSAMTADCNSG